MHTSKIRGKDIKTSYKNVLVFVCVFVRVCACVRMNEKEWNMIEEDMSE